MEVSQMRSCLDSLMIVQKRYYSTLEKIVAQHNLTIAEWQLLLKVIDGNQTQEKLARLTSLNVSTLSRQLARLVAKEFVSRFAGEETNRHGGRKKYNYVETNKGKTVVKQLQQDIKKFADNLFQHWSVDELSMLQILLNRLDRSMERL
jgi:DNA-binding MarR family transcriptional regulator